MKYQSLFPEYDKNIINFINLSSAECAQRVVKVNITMCLFFFVEVKAHIIFRKPTARANKMYCVTFILNLVWFSKLGDNLHEIPKPISSV